MGVGKPLQQVIISNLTHLYILVSTMIKNLREMTYFKSVITKNTSSMALYGKK